MAFLAALFVATLFSVPDAAPTITSISPSIGGAVNFTGDDTKFLTVSNSSGINLGGSDFTISWWHFLSWLCVQLSFRLGRPG